MFQDGQEKGKFGQGQHWLDILGTGVCVGVSW